MPAHVTETSITGAGAFLLRTAVAATGHGIHHTVRTASSACSVISRARRLQERAGGFERQSAIYISLRAECAEARVRVACCRAALDVNEMCVQCDGSVDSGVHI